MTVDEKGNEVKSLPRDNYLVKSNSGSQANLTLNIEALSINSMIDQGELVETLGGKLTSAISRMKSGAGAAIYDTPDKDKFDKNKKEILSIATEIMARVAVAEFGFFWTPTKEI